MPAAASQAHFTWSGAAANILCARTTHSALDLWMRGSGTTAISLYLEDSTGRRFSKDIRFTRPDQVREGAAVAQAALQVPACASHEPAAACLLACQLLHLACQTNMPNCADAMVVCPPAAG